MKEFEMKQTKKKRKGSKAMKLMARRIGRRANQPTLLKSAVNNRIK